MPRKYIRFNYFTIKLVPDGIPDNMIDADYTTPWNMTEILDYLSVRRNNLAGNIDVGIYIADFERDTLMYDQHNNLYSFQISKLRENNIPALKRIGNPKEDIAMAEDQYLGEFVTVIFDPQFITVAVQSNLYSLNIPQLEIYLTVLRRRFKELLGNPDAFPLKVEMHPIIDPSKITAIENSDIYRKITIKGSNYSAEALAQQGSLNEVSEFIGQARGVNFELTLSLGSAPKDETLDSDTIQEIIAGFNGIENDQNRPKVEITAREDIEAPLEVVNLLSPRLTNLISLVVENRRGISHEIIHATFVESYGGPRTAIARVNRAIND